MIYFHHTLTDAHFWVQLWDSLLHVLEYTFFGLYCCRSFLEFTTIRIYDKTTLSGQQEAGERPGFALPRCYFLLVLARLNYVVWAEWFQYEHRLFDLITSFVWLAWELTGDLTTSQSSHFLQVFIFSLSLHMWKIWGNFQSLFLYFAETCVFTFLTFKKP